MLNLERIGFLIADPSQINSSDMIGLRDLADKYSYSSIFSLLYLYGLKQSGSVQFEEELKKHSYRISDRTNLYHLLNNSTPTLSEDLELISPPDEEEINEPIPLINSEESIPSEEVDTSEKNIFEDSTTEEKTSGPITDDPDDEDDESDVIADQDNEEHELDDKEPFNKAENKEELEPYFDYEFSIEELDGLEFVRIEKEVDEELEEAKGIVHTDAVPEEETTEVEPIDQIDPLEENIQHHIISAGYHLESLTPEEEEELEAKEREKTTEPSVESDIKDNTHEPANFLSWLKADKNYVSKPLQDPNLSQGNVSAFSEFNPLDELTGEVKRPRKEFFSPTKKAKESLDESQLPVSETLAKIYVLQGNYPRAIQVYEQLMLKFPEKKVFFANSIAQIKEKLNTIE
ncbi:MAG: tetratricopeptide repeat-containing protein [Bacteroidetes bacterium]|nr:MAG: tetratricopeptide repeat-containing protein [Bacteroidota bacterium]